MKILATIILYEPNFETLNKFLSVINHSAEVLLLDNSLKSNKSLISNFTHYHFFSKNKGLAYAKNFAIDYAKKNNFTHITFFDQDSNIDKDFFFELSKIIKNNNDDIFGPNILDIKNKKYLPLGQINSFFKKNDSEDFIKKKVDHIISSGMTVKLSVFEKKGIFNDQLFIDYVDYEWCLRKKNLYKIYVYKCLILHHSIGNKIIKFFKLNIYIHDNKRTFYQIRNIFWILRLNEIKRSIILKEILVLITHKLLALFFVKKKLEYLGYVFKGFKDGLFYKI